MTRASTAVRDDNAAAGLVHRPIARAPKIGLGMATVKRTQTATVEQFLNVARTGFTQDRHLMPLESQVLAGEV